MPVEPHTHMHTGAEEPGTFGAQPEISTTEQSTRDGCVCTRVCQIDWYTTKMKMAAMQETDERKESGDERNQLTTIPTVQARGGQAAAVVTGWGVKVS